MATQETRPVQTRSSNGILQIIMNRPEKKNALTQEMYALMTDALTYAAEEGSIRVAVFQGTDGVFCAGNDLQDFLGTPISEKSPVFQFIESLIAFPKILAANVEGVAIGIGTTMLLHCDLVYASDNAFFQLPFSRLGLCAEAGSSVLLPRAIGMTRAATLLTTGDSIDSRTAAGWGLISAFFPEEIFETEAMKRLGQVAAMPPAALRHTRALLRKPLEEEVRAAVLREARQFQECLQGAEAAEALRAFLEKRPPDFSSFA